MNECPLLSRCGFFLKYQESRDLACRGFIRTFCRGPQQPECKRLEYRQQHGASPAEDMLPTGLSIAHR